MGRNKKWYRKELICTNHGHELRGDARVLEGGGGREGRN